MSRMDRMSRMRSMSTDESTPAVLSRCLVSGLGKIYV